MSEADEYYIKSSHIRSWDLPNLFTTVYKILNFFCVCFVLLITSKLKQYFLILETFSILFWPFHKTLEPERWGCSLVYTVNTLKKMAAVKDMTLFFFSFFCKQKPWSEMTRVYAASWQIQCKWSVRDIDYILLIICTCVVSKDLDYCLIVTSVSLPFICG